VVPSALHEPVTVSPDRDSRTQSGAEPGACAVRSSRPSPLESNENTQPLSGVTAMFAKPRPSLPARSMLTMRPARAQGPVRSWLTTRVVTVAPTAR